MADTITTASTLTLLAGFADDDDRSITLDNPNAVIAAADIITLGSFAKTKKILIGDKAGASFTRFKSAKKRTRTVTNLDLTP